MANVVIIVNSGTKEVHSLQGHEEYNNLQLFVPINFVAGNPLLGNNSPNNLSPILDNYLQGFSSLQIVFL